MKVNNYRIFGIIMILIGILLFFPTPLEHIIRPLTQPILMGSSKGKDILFFVLFGITIILSTICDNEKIHNHILNSNIPNKLKYREFYLKISLILLLFLGIMGLIIEIYLRNVVGIGLNTIFVSMNPNLTTTSILHSHLYKSLFGTILASLLTYIPSGIHLGNSLAIYTPKITYYLFILIPLLYILMIGSLQKRKVISRIFLAFTSSIGIIGLLDGGFFATPAVGGVYGILIILFNEHVLDNLTDKLRKNEKSKTNSSVLKIIKNSLISFINYVITTLKNLNNIFRFKKEYLDFWKTWAPHLILLFIIILRFSVAIYGGCDEFYEVNIYNCPDNVDLSPYHTLNIIESGNKTIVYVSNEYNEMELLNNLGKTLDGKCDWYSLSWNINSYIEKPTPTESID